MGFGVLTTLRTAIGRGGTLVAICWLAEISFRTGSLKRTLRTSKCSALALPPPPPPLAQCDSLCKAHLDGLLVEVLERASHEGADVDLRLHIDCGGRLPRGRQQVIRGHRCVAGA